MEEILIGTTDRTILVFILDPAQTDGSGKTGLVAANLTVTYTRVETDNDVVRTDVTSSLNNLSALTDTHNDWGLLEVDASLAPGLYRLDVADALFASGAWYAVLYVMITSGAAVPSPKAFKLVNFDLFGQSAADLKDFADDGYDPSTNKVQGVVTTDTATAVTTVNGLAANVITATSINTGAITSAKFASGAIDAAAIAPDAIGASELAEGAADEIAGRVWAASATTLQVTDGFGELVVSIATTVTTMTGNMTTILNRIGAFTGTGVNTVLGFFRALMRKDGSITTPSDVGGAYAHTTDSAEAQRDNIGTPSDLGGGATVAANLSDIEGQTDDIGVAGAGLTALPAGTLTAGERNSIATALLDLSDGVETGETVRQFCRLLRSVLVGISDADDPESGTVIFKRKDGTTTALTVAYNNEADRTSSTVGTV